MNQYHTAFSFENFIDLLWIFDIPLIDFIVASLLKTKNIRNIEFLEIIISQPNLILEIIQECNRKNFPNKIKDETACLAKKEQIKDALQVLLSHPLNKTNFLVDQIGQIVLTQNLNRLENAQAIHELLRLFIKMSAFGIAYIQCASNSAYLLNLLSVGFDNEIFIGIKLQNTNLSGASFNGTDLSESQFTEIDLTGCSFKDANLSKIDWLKIESERFAVLKGHSKQITAIAFSPDGQILASTSIDETVRFWDSKTGLELETLQSGTGAAYAIAFSPIGSILATSYFAKYSLTIWNLNTKQIMHKLLAHTGIVYSITFSPNGLYLASGSYDQNVILWDAQQGISIRVLEGHTSCVNSVQFSHDGQRLASGSEDQRIIIWKVESGEQILQIECQRSGPIWRLVYSPCAEQIAYISVDADFIKILDAANGEEKIVLTGHQDSVSCLVYSEDGYQLVSGSRDRTIRIWGANSGKQIRVLTGDFRSTLALAISPKFPNQLASVSDDYTISFWNLDSKDCLSLSQGHQKSITSAAFSPNNTKLALGGFDCSIELWEAENMKKVKCMNLPDNKISWISYLNENFIVSRSNRYTMRVWDVKRGVSIRTQKIPKNLCWQIVTSPVYRGCVLSVSSGQTSFLNLQSGRQIRSRECSCRGVNSIAISADGQTFAEAKISIKVWNFVQSIQIAQFDGHHRLVLCLEFSNDGMFLASGGKDNILILWNLKTKALARKFAAFKGSINSISFAQKYPVLAAGSADNMLSLWNLETGNLVQQFHVQCSRITQVLFSPDGQYLVSCNDDCFQIMQPKVLFWSTNSFERMKLVAVSLERRLLAYGTKDGRIEVWEDKSAKKCFVWELRGHQKSILALSFTKCASHLISASYDITIRLWCLVTGCSKKIINFSFDGGLSALILEFTQLSSNQKTFEDILESRQQSNVRSQLNQLSSTGLVCFENFHYGKALKSLNFSGVILDEQSVIRSNFFECSLRTLIDKTKHI